MQHLQQQRRASRVVESFECLISKRLPRDLQRRQQQPQPQQQQQQSQQQQQQWERSSRLIVRSASKRLRLTWLLYPADMYFT